MMTKTQAEYTSSGGDKAKVWDTIQKEVLVQGGREEQIVCLQYTKGRDLGQSVHTNQTLHQGGGGECFFFLKRGGGNWEGLEVRFQEDGIRGWQDWKAQENANNSFHSSDCVVKEIMNFILKASFICVIFTAILNFSSNVVECPTIQSGRVSSIVPYKLSPSLAVIQPTVQEVKQILPQKKYIQR